MSEPSIHCAYQPLMSGLLHWREIAEEPLFCQPICEVLGRRTDWAKPVVRHDEKHGIFTSLSAQSVKLTLNKAIAIKDGVALRACVTRHLLPKKVLHLIGDAINDNRKLPG